MYVDDEGIVLRVVRYDDASSVAHVFTRSRGHVAFMVTRPKSRHSSGATICALLRPMNVLSFQWEAKPHAALYRMKDVRSATTWCDMPYHPVKSAVALLLSEFLCHALAEEGENVALYDYVVASLRWFDAAPTAFANFHLVFLLKITRFLGIAPDADSYVPGHAFDVESGVFAPQLMASPLALVSSDATLLHALLAAGYDDMPAIAMNRTDRARMITYIGRFYRVHVAGFPEIKSLDVLETLFE